MHGREAFVWSTFSLAFSIVSRTLRKLPSHVLVACAPAGNEYRYGWSNGSRGVLSCPPGGGNPFFHVNVVALSLCIFGKLFRSVQ